MNDFEVQQLALDASLEHVIVERSLEGQLGARQVGKASAEAAQPDRILFHRRLSHREKEIVIVVDAHPGGKLRVTEEAAQARGRRGSG